MKKILFVITKSNWGGAQRYVFDLASGLSPESFDVAVAMGGTGEASTPPGKLHEKLLGAGVRTLFIPSFTRDISFVKEFRAFFELVRMFRSEKPHVVHLNSSKAGALGALAARLSGVPRVIFTSHGLAWDEDRNIIAKTLVYLTTRITFLLCHVVITISQDNYERAQKGFFTKKKIQLVHNGLAPITFLSMQDARGVLGAPAEGVVIGTIAELTWNKGLHTLVRAVGTLKEKGLLFSVYIIGEGEERGFLETLIAEEKLTEHVHFTGFVSDAFTLMKAFDIFTLPSIKEGLPYVLLEAGQAGRASVATRISGSADIIEETVSGFLVPPKDEHALAEALSKLIQDAVLREQLGSHLESRVRGEFSLQHMVEKTLALY